MTGKPLSFDAMQAKASEAAEFMRLFSTPSRLMLLCHIAGKERSVGEIQEALDFKQPALSQQLPNCARPAWCRRGAPRGRSTTRSPMPGWRLS